VSLLFFPLVINGRCPYLITGGGKFEIDRKKKHIRLYDDSLAYGKFDRRGLKERILSIAEFSKYKVQIE